MESLERYVYAGRELAAVDWIRMSDLAPEPEVFREDTPAPMKRAAPDQGRRAFAGWVEDHRNAAAVGLLVAEDGRISARSIDEAGLRDAGEWWAAPPEWIGERDLEMPAAFEDASIGLADEARAAWLTELCRAANAGSKPFPLVFWAPMEDDDPERFARHCLTNAQMDWVATAIGPAPPDTSGWSRRVRRRSSPPFSSSRSRRPASKRPSCPPRIA